MDETILSATCANCHEAIYSAGGPEQKGQLGWLHQDTSESKCFAETPRATPTVEGQRTCHECNGELQATVKINLSDVVLRDGEIVGFRVVIAGDDAIDQGLTLKETIENAIGAAMGDECRIYCQNDHDYDEGAE